MDFSLSCIGRHLLLDVDINVCMIENQMKSSAYEDKQHNGSSDFSNEITSLMLQEELDVERCSVMRKERGRYLVGGRLLLWEMIHDEERYFLNLLF